ncbi:hypothetical protein HPB47_009683 [Ixodes persulcatus]|uniref:Uncharacterized protein n=1 Tax=Ixodes persulcatus TaxID=34615 RepID=A0AC60P176_IXOPE|nr:hypothetical protein HPB47_009683 [Ixodes persulcatus]
MGNGEPQGAAAGSPASISSVAVRLPPYLDKNPRVWFLQVESQFHLGGVTSQESKYHHDVSALSLAAADEGPSWWYCCRARTFDSIQFAPLNLLFLARTNRNDHQLEAMTSRASHVFDILAQPSPTASYDQLKAALLQRTEASDRSRLQELLTAEELGDRRPSQLLRRMTQLLGVRANTIGDALLRELFIQRLPTNVQMVLATARALDLTGLAALADAVIEVSTPPVTSLTSATEDGGEAMPALPGTPSSDGNVEQPCQRLQQSVTETTHRRDRPRTQQQPDAGSRKEPVPHQGQSRPPAMLLLLPGGTLARRQSPGECEPLFKSTNVRNVTTQPGQKTPAQTMW